MSDRRPLAVYFGHHKCASTWINRILDGLCRSTGRRFVNVHNPEMFDEDLAGFVRRNEIDVLAYSNADWRYVRDLEGFTGFHVIRDPRDILVSAYYSHLHSHSTTHWSELEAHRAKLKECSKEEGLFVELDFRRKEFGHLASWNYGLPDVLELKMEDVIANPYQGFLEIFRAMNLLDESGFSMRKELRFLILQAMNVMFEGRLDLRIRLGTGRIPAEKILAAVYDNRFEKLAGGRKPGQADPTAHFRKGTAGDWKNHFSEALVSEFKRRHNDLLVRLGYEADDTWGVGSDFGAGHTADASSA